MKIAGISRQKEKTERYIMNTIFLNADTCKQICKTYKASKIIL